MGRQGSPVATDGGWRGGAAISGKKTSLSQLNARYANVFLRERPGCGESLWFLSKMHGSTFSFIRSTCVEPEFPLNMLEKKKCTTCFKSAVYPQPLLIVGPRIPFVQVSRSLVLSKNRYGIIHKSCAGVILSIRKCHVTDPHRSKLPE